VSLQVCPNCKRSMGEPVRRISAREVSNRTGLTLSTLSKRRRLGQPPDGWMYISATFVVYPENEVDRFLEDRSKRNAFGHLLEEVEAAEAELEDDRAAGVLADLQDQSEGDRG
jgi:predicted DNA-binding transcriptional regulator AlpA